jgi:hypothetical protein
MTARAHYVPRSRMVPGPGNNDSRRRAPGLSSAHGAVILG